MGTFVNRTSTLKILTPIEQDERFSEIHSPEHLLRIVGRATDPEPKHINRHARFLNAQLSGGSYH